MKLLVTFWQYWCMYLGAKSEARKWQRYMDANGILGDVHVIITWPSGRTMTVSGDP